MPRRSRIALIALVLASCTGGATRGDQTPPEASVQRSIEEVHKAVTQEWMEVPGVVGTGIGLYDDEPCIKVFVAGPVGPAERLIPKEVEGHRIVLERTGPFQPRDTGSTGGGRS